MTDETVRDVYVFCERCQQNIIVKVPTTSQRRAGGLLRVVAVHGQPKHGLLAYVDNQFRVRGVEYSDFTSTQTDNEVDMTTLNQMTNEAELGLKYIVMSMGKKEKDGIKAFALILAQLLTRRNVILIHDDAEVRSRFTSSINGLFSTQSVLLEAMNSEQLAGESRRFTCIFDLQTKEFVDQGPKVNARFFDTVIKDLLNEEKGHLALRTELSKLFYSYQEVKKILSSVRSSILDTKLASDASVDLEVLPIMLEMAQSEGINTKSRVVQDSLAKSIRSI